MSKTNIKKLTKSDILELTKDTKPKIVLERDGQGVPKRTTKNLLILLDEQNTIVNKLSKDRMSGDIVLTQPYKLDESDTILPPSILIPEKMNLIGGQFVKKYNVSFEIKHIGEALSVLALCNNVQHSELRNLLNTFPKWDGVDYISSYVRDTLGVNDWKQGAKLLSKLLVQHLEMIDGKTVKSEIMVMLLGAKGIGKTSAIELLNYTGSSPRIGGFSTSGVNRERVFEYANQPILIDDEALALNRKDLFAKFKQFTSQTTWTKVRRSFDPIVRDIHRSWLLFGTSNQNSFNLENERERRLAFWQCEKNNITKPVWELPKDFTAKIWSQAIALQESEHNSTITRADENEYTANQKHHRILDSFDRITLVFLLQEITLNDENSVVWLSLDTFKNYLTNAKCKQTTTAIYEKLELMGFTAVNELMGSELTTIFYISLDEYERILSEYNFTKGD